MSATQISLTPSDWVEVYYALESKAQRIESGHYGPDGLDGVCNAEWVGQLRAIQREIASSVNV